MNICVLKSKKRFLTILILLASIGTGSLCRAYAIKSIDIGQITSFDEMKAALAYMETTLEDATKNNMLPYAIQRDILSRAGESISRLAYLCQTNQSKPESVKASGKLLFSANRDIIKRILTINEETIKKFQETVLDTLQDPQGFFQTPQWQQPQQFISLASYWLGWNGYYASLVIPETDLLRKQMLTEAVDGFSRAFIDFEDEAVVAKSLFGRGLCYRQLKKYQSALYDFKSVKDRIKDDEVFITRCLYEEAAISYETGNLRLALGKLDQIAELCDEGKIPDAIVATMDELRAKVLLSKFGKSDNKPGVQKDSLNAACLSVFKEMKPLAVRRRIINDVFYRYVRTHAAGLRQLSYDELGPVATMAVGDWYYDKKEYDKALDAYLRLHTDTALPFTQYVDRLWYRTAYIYSKKKQWPEALGLLNRFHKKFQESQFTPQAASLYYTAASNNYRSSGKSDAYEEFIHAIKTYLAICDNGSYQSDAHFQLARYYQNNGTEKQALIEFSKVGKDSSYYFQAQCFRMESYVRQLEILSKNGRRDSQQAMQVYQDGLGVIHAYHLPEPGEIAAVNRKKTEPYMSLLQARFYLFGSAEDKSKGIELLEGFQRQYLHEKALFLDAAKLKIEYTLLIGKESSVETEIDRLFENAALNPSEYASLQALADKFFTEMKRMKTGEGGQGSNRYASASLMIYEKLFAISKENASYRNYCDPIELRMAQICMEENKFNRAAELYLDILRRNPRSADAVYGLGLIYEEQGQWQEALQAWRRFSDGVEAGTYYWFQSRYRTAVALRKLGKTKKACGVATMTLVLHPDFGDMELKKKFLDFQSEFCKKEPMK